MAAALIKGLGVYPPGDFVKLRNGETAIVVQRTAAGNAPIVAVLADAGGRPVHGAPDSSRSLLFPRPGPDHGQPALDRAGLPERPESHQSRIVVSRQAARP